MLERNKFALKEWAVTVEFLGEGKQIFVLRKGGIQESGNRFSVPHPEFFLFPTYTHQAASALSPSARLRLAAEVDRASQSVSLAYYARVKEVVHLSKLASLRRLEGHHSLNWAAVEQRYHYRDRPGLWLLVLRVYRQSPPHCLPCRPRYSGCRSWVELDREVSTLGVKEVLSEQAFQEQLHNLHCSLQLG